MVWVIMRRQGVSSERRRSSCSSLYTCIGKMDEPLTCMLVKYYAKCLDDCSVYWLACLLCRTVSRENKPVVEPAREKSESKPVVERYQCSLTISVLVVLRTCHWLGAFSSDSARKQHDRLFSLAFQLNPLLHRSHIHIFTLVFISPPASTKLKGGILVSPCPQSGCPSVCGRNRVCSVSSTILAESIAFLHVLSTNFKRCVSCWFFSCDQAALQMVFSVCPSVRLSVRPSVRDTFLTMFPSLYHHEIFRSYYQWQKWRPCKRSRSEVKGQGHRGHNPTLQFPDCNSSLNSRMMMKWCILLDNA